MITDAKDNRNYSEQYLEKIKNRETDSVSVYGEFCFLEGKFIYAYALEKEHIKEELDKLAAEHGLK